MANSKEPNFRIGSALFNADHGHLADEIERIKSAGIDFIHFDVFDGYFVSEMGFPPKTIENLRPLTKLPFEIHLGANDPLRFMPPLKKAGADLVLFHFESVAMPFEAVFKAKEIGIKVGLAVTLGTEISLLNPVIELLDSVLLLSRVTGEGVTGATFDNRVFSQLDGLAKMIKGKNITLDIQVAGGVRRKHLQDLVCAGVSSIAFGSGLYKADDMAMEAQAMRDEITESYKKLD